MLPKLLLLDPDPRGVDSSKYCHLVTQRWTQGASVPPRGPEEAWKNLRTCSPKEREGFSTLPGALGSHPECLRVVAVRLEPTPSRVWKGAVLVMSPI